MKNGRSVWAIAAAAFVALSMCLSAVCVASGIQYDTLRFDVDVVVSERSAYEVTERIDVEFYSPAHGIYRYIPTDGRIRYVDRDGVEQSARARLRIDDIDTGGVQLDKSRSGVNLVLRLGSPDITVTGPKSYSIRYTARTYDDEIEEFDQVYWNLIPTGWETSIAQASFRIEMPKDFDDASLEWITGYAGSGQTDEVSWTRDGLVIYGTLDRPLEKGEGVTLRIVLPEGYFTGAESDVWMTAVSGTVSVLAALMALLLFFRFGKEDKIIPVVEFYPPDDLSPAEVGYIMDARADAKDILSLIPYFAHKGYMKIHRLEPKKKLLGKPVERFEFEKLQDLPSDAPLYQTVFFTGLFLFGNPVRSDDLPEEFGTTFRSAQTSLATHFKLDEDRRIHKKSSVAATGCGCMLTIVPVVAATMMAGAAMIAPSVMGAAVLVSFVSFLVALFSTIFMRKRTVHNAALLGRLHGFRNFIKVAELDRIKVLVNDDPEYFYNILPYAYVFGLTNEWMKHFETLHVPEPSWYTGDTGTFQMMYLANSMNALATSIPTSPPSESGSSGGSSSGGGFSGGGFGGGGGGAW